MSLIGSWYLPFDRNASSTPFPSLIYYYTWFKKNKIDLAGVRTLCCGGFMNEEFLFSLSDAQPRLVGLLTLWNV